MTETEFQIRPGTTEAQVESLNIPPMGSRMTDGIRRAHYLITRAAFDGRIESWTVRLDGYLSDNPSYRLTYPDGCVVECDDCFAVIAELEEV